MIHGASGAVGNAAVQIARSMGVTVVGTAGTKDGMEVVLKCGVSKNLPTIAFFISFLFIFRLTMFSIIITSLMKRKWWNCWAVKVLTSLLSI